MYQYTDFDRRFVHARAAQFRDQLERKPGDFPALEAHHARMLERPAVKKTIEIEAKV